MIQAELRIGNWVEKKQNLPVEYGKVTQVYMDGFTVDYHYPGGWYSPIPLSPEILEKCGFVQDSDDEATWMVLRTTKFDFIEGDRNGFCEVYMDFDDGLRVQYLHQLQNLYFALTGQELNIKL